MKKINRQFCILILLFSFSKNIQAQFLPGNIVVVRVGNGSSALTSASTAVFLDEYTPAGTLVQSIALPTAANGSNQPITLSGSAISEGGLTRSPDGKYLAMAGYATAPGLDSVHLTTSASTNRVIARIDAAGNINSTTRLSSSFSGSNIRCAVTNDGTQFWVAGNSSGTTGAGIVYTSLGNTGGTKILATPNNTRYVSIFNGQLHATSGTSGFRKVFAIGSGLPTTGGQTQRSYPGFDSLNASPYAFAIDTTGTICYIADARSIANGGGVQKWALQDTVWTLTATFTNNISTGVYGIAVDWAAPYPKIYATTQSQIIQITDSGSVITSATILDSASTNTAFRGIALAPILPQTGVNDKLIPIKSCLLTNYPNPFNPKTNIAFSIVGTQHAVSLRVYDILGREIKTLINEIKAEGSYSVEWDGKNSAGQIVGSGVYFCRLRNSNGTVITKKLLLIK